METQHLLSWRYVIYVIVFCLFFDSNASCNPYSGEGFSLRITNKTANQDQLFERAKILSAPKNHVYLDTMHTESEGETTFMKFLRRKPLVDEVYDSDVPQDSDTPREIPLLAFRIISCSMVAVFVGITIIIYVTSGMFYQDCVAQICSEVSLLAAYTGILLITTERARVEWGFCVGVAIFLHFAFLCFFLFLLLEVVCMARLLLRFVPKTFLSTTRSVLLLGFGIPVFIVGISSIVLYHQYTSKNNCWLQLNKDAMWLSVIPIGISVGIQLIFLLCILLVSEVPFLLSNSEYDRAKCFLTTRYASLIIIVFASLSWSFGLMSSYSNEESYYAAFTVSSIFLGVVIFILRVSTDDEIRKMMTSHVLCYVTKPTNKISAWSEKVLQSNAIPMEKKLSMETPQINGNINRNNRNSMNNGFVVNHR